MTVKSLKHYRIGDIIMTAKPVVYVVVDHMKTSLCDYCLQKKAPLMACNDCRQMFYCNQICQQNDWSYHRLECHHFANSSPHLKSSTKLMIRLWLSMAANPEIALKTYALPNGQFISLNDMKVNANIGDDIIALMAHMKDNSFLGSQDLESLDQNTGISVKDMAVLQFKALVDTFSDCQIEADWTQLWRLFLKVWSNVLKMDVLDFGDDGDSVYGLFVDVSALSHSCEPNACYVSYGSRLQVRAIKAIKPHEEITISYIDVSNPKPIRQQLLKSYFIVCNCLKCQITCDTNIDYEVFRKLKDNFNEMLESPKGTDKCNIEDMLSMAEKLVPFYEAIYEDYYPDLSLFLVKYLKLMLLNASETTAVINRKYLEFVVENVRTTHGIDHKIYRKLHIIRDITLLDLASDTDQVLKCLKSKPTSRLRSYTLRAFIFLVIYYIYTNFGVIVKQMSG